MLMMKINVSIFHKRANNSSPNDSTCVLFANFKSKHSFAFENENIVLNALKMDKNRFGSEHSFWYFTTKNCLQ